MKTFKLDDVIELDNYLMIGEKIIPKRLIYYAPEVLEALEDLTEAFPQLSDENLFHIPLSGGDTVEYLANNFKKYNELISLVRGGEL